MTGSTPWLLRPRSDPRADLRLFCFPYAGGGASLFRRWADILPAGVEVCPVQLPGREGRFREAAFDRLPPLVETLARELRAFLDRPFAFFGHSMGALLGFELARQLRRMGAAGPAHLFVSGRRAPQVARSEAPIHALPDAAFRDEHRRFTGTPAAVLDNAELLELLLPTLRADFTLVETYTHHAEAPSDTPITAFGGTDDPLASWEQLDAWRAQTTGSFRLCMVPGGHFFLQTAELSTLEEIARDLHSPRRQHPVASAPLVRSP